MTDEHDQHDQHDPELEARLRAADPASDLPPADPTRVARLLEDTMADPHIDESRADGTRNRSRLTWLVAAAAVLLIGGGVVLATTLGDDETPPSAGDVPSEATTPSESTSAADGEQTVTELTAAAGVQARCMVPAEAPQVVAGQETVFDGVVESISGSAVTLVPSTFYTGEETDLVVVQAPGPEMESLLSAVSFEEGGRYLVAATDGRVTLCGFSARYSDALAAVYAEAFPG